MEKTAKLLKIGLQRFEVRELASSRMPFQKDQLRRIESKQRVDAVALPEDDFLNANQNQIVELAAKHRIPSIGREMFAEAGG